MASVAEISPLGTGTSTPKGFKKAVEEIAQVIFQKTKISLEGSAKAVMPSIPVVLKEIADDIRTGSVEKFKISLDKLEKITGKLGVDLSKYNKELAGFLKNREQNTIKSEEKIIEIREKGAKAEIDQITGKINLLSREEIKARTDTLKQTLVQQKKITKEKNKEEKQIKESRFLTEKEIETKKAFVIESYEQLQLLDVQKQELMSKLNITDEEDLPGTGFMGFGGGKSRDSGGGEGIREFVPDFLLQFSDGIMDQLSTFFQPFVILKDIVFDLLKPLKILGKLFKPLIAGMGKLIKSIGRQILSGMALVAVNLLRLLTDKKVLIGLAAIAAIIGLKKLHDKFKDGPDGPKAGSAGDIAGEASGDALDSHFGEDKTISARDPKDPIAPFYDKESGKVIQPGDPNYFEIKKRLGLPLVGMEDRVQNNNTLKSNEGSTIPNDVSVSNNSSVIKTDNTSSPTTIISSSVNESQFASNILD
jgi:hypothetical protein